MVCSDASKWRWSNFSTWEIDKDLSNDSNVDSEMALIKNVSELYMNQR